MYEAEERSKNFVEHLADQRKKRSEGKANTKEIVELREENKILKERCERYERIIETSVDPELLRKFFDIEQQHKYGISSAHLETEKDL